MEVLSKDMFLRFVFEFRGKGIPKICALICYGKFPNYERDVRFSEFTMQDSGFYPIAWQF